MAYFHCLIGGGSSGGGYELTVTCDAAFAGTTITATDGVTTLTQTCPSASPYEVVFAIPNGGEWTISGIISGQTYSTAIDIPDELELIAIPDGSTATPTDVIQTWLRCSGIFDKSYTTLNEVLADSVTLLALMSNDNAVDYLVRSTTWASGITADSTAMTDIGANNYCANTLLSDSTWLDAIANSTYIDSVLNVKVPAMTSDTTPSDVGTCGATYFFSGYPAYRSFDNNASTAWSAGGRANETVYFHFNSNVKIYMAILTPEKSSGYSASTKDWDIVSSEDTTSWNVETSGSNTDSNTPVKVYITNPSNSYYWGAKIKTSYREGQSYSVTALQFYGRADV